MTDETTKDKPADDPKDQPPADVPAGDAPADAADDGADGDADATEDEAPVGHPPPASVLPGILPEAAEKPKRKVKKGETATVVYGGPRDVFTWNVEGGDPVKFRPGVPTVIGAGEVDELLTYPGHTFTEVDAEEDQEKADGNT